MCVVLLSQMLHAKCLCVVSLSQMLHAKCLCAVPLSQVLHVKCLCVFSCYLRYYMLNVYVCFPVISDVTC